MELNKQSYRARKRTEIAERQAKVSEYYRRGCTEREIADEVGCSLATVSGDIQALIAQWKKVAQLNLEAHIATELERINRLEAAAWDSFGKSKLPRKVGTVRKALSPMESDNGTKSTVEVSTATATEYHEPAGDARFLVIIKSCIAERIRLLRLADHEANGAADKEKGPMTFERYVALCYEVKDAEEELGLGKKKRTAPTPDPPPQLP